MGLPWMGPPTLDGSLSYCRLTDRQPLTPARLIGSPLNLVCGLWEPEEDAQREAGGQFQTPNLLGRQ